MKYYAGIGSRETPPDIREEIHEIVEFLNTKEMILLSGGAPGADFFFEEKADRKMIFLPWKRFNGNESHLYPGNDAQYDTYTSDAYGIARQFHPRWDKLSEGAKSLMCRNSMQVLNIQVCEPVDFIVCWTKDGRASGGTGQALRIAKAYEVPIFNLYDPTAKSRLKTFVNMVRLF